MKIKRDVVADCLDRMHRVSAWRKSKKVSLATRANQIKCARNLGLNLAMVRDAVAGLRRPTWVAGVGAVGREVAS